MRDSNQLDTLLAHLVEGTITGGEFAKLEAILDGNPQAQRCYLHYLGLHSDLQACESLPTRSDTPRQRRPLAALAIITAAAAAIVLAAVMFFSAEQYSRPIARVAELSGSITWIGDDGRVVQDLEIGYPLGGGALESLAANSWVEIEFLDSSRVSISGHSALTVSQGEAGKLIRLQRGDLSADVTPQPEGKPMRLITPSAEAQILGTQFNVTADANSTRLSVNEGLVSVERLADGSVEKVSADHVVVAALERQSEFKSIPRSKYTETWRSQFPRDIRRGDLMPGSHDEPCALRTKSCLWTNDRGETELHYSVNIGASATSRPPIKLSKNAYFRVHGRLESSQQIIFGLTTNHLRRGFSGKYITARKIDVRTASDGEFLLKLPLRTFRRNRDRFPDSPINLEFFDCWFVTMEDAGLEIIQVELIVDEGGADE